MSNFASPSVFPQQLPTPTPTTEYNTKLLSTFTSQYVHPDFMKQIVNVLLYQTDLSTAHGSGRTADALKTIRTFLIETQKDVDRMHSVKLDYPTNFIKSLLRFTSRILELKSDLSGRLLTYDNLDSHFSNLDIHLKKIIQDIKLNPISNISQFRGEFDKVMQTIQLASELRTMRKTLIDLDLLCDQAEKGKESLLNLTINFRNTMISAYGDISNLKVVNKVNELSDYILFSDEASVNVVAQNITKFLTEGYSFYKSGYNLIDSNILGIESSNVHVICGPSNNAKSIFMINLMWQIILNNIQEFQPSDLFVYYTLED